MKNGRWPVLGRGAASRAPVEAAATDGGSGASGGGAAKERAAGIAGPTASSTSAASAAGTSSGPGTSAPGPEASSKIEYPVLREALVIEDPSDDAALAAVRERSSCECWS